MPTVRPTHDRDEIRRRLHADRVWSIYALADLDAALFPQCDWWICGAAGLALVFKGIRILPIFVQGRSDEVRELLTELPVERGYLNLRNEHVPAAEGLHYQYDEPHRMRRMVIQSLGRESDCEAIPLGPEHLDEVEALYATGDGPGESLSEPSNSTRIRRLPEACVRMANWQPSQAST